MAAFDGVRDFVSAVTGGNDLNEQARYNASLNRLVRQRSAQTQLDRQLELLSRERDINARRGSLATSITDPVIRDITLANSGAGSNFSGAQTGVQTGIKSEAIQAALDAITGASNGGAIDTDLINALTGVSSGKLLGPGNVRVQDQAGADIGLTEAQRLEAIAGVGAENALTLKRGAETGKLRAETPSGPLPLDFEEISSVGADSLVLDPDTIPVDSGGFLGINALGGTTEDLPLSDPRAQKKFASMTADQQAALLQYLGPEFTQWRVAQSVTDPNMVDETYAIGKFLAQRQGGGSAIPRGAAVSGASKAPNSAPIIYGTDANGNLVITQ